MNRVSFEIQSSDNETCSSLASDSTDYISCVDSLCPQRLSLLNLVQLAKLKIDKLSFISSGNNLTKIIESINNLEQQNGKSIEQPRTTKLSKPPRAVKTANTDLFFIEYQFPIVANTRDGDSSNSGALMATQAMRVVSKKPKNFFDKNNDDSVLFDHHADYSVLFNSQSLENWWRSSISFKIYCRSSIQNASGTSTPYLIGQARLSLKNALKSKNFKLMKKLAVYDTLDQMGHKKRIGTLHANIELASDLKQFNIDLNKLKNFEQKLSRNKKSQPPQSPVKQLPVVYREEKPQPRTDNEINRLNIERSLSLPKFTVEKEQTVPVSLYFLINEVRGFNISFDQSSNVYLICRLFWNKEKVIS